jgi:hypothetical protein
MDFAVTVETTIEMDTKDLDGYAAKLPLRWLDGAFRELRQPNPMSIPGKVVAARRAANKRARRERKRQRKQARRS